MYHYIWVFTGIQTPDMSTKICLQFSMLILLQTGTLSPVLYPKIRYIFIYGRKHNFCYTRDAYMRCNQRKFLRSFS
ncbi:hypothetical protein XIS1_460076 [Xenorhabdus innexi]|uniref:Uncharacterized protein n=1 Tax=Xenorhabdus innexi TaxID=290109 RepID=A0A1N6MY63_9GAMM|nr:hypothetical protein XIS1_460076 [Xenorhabdus innexi]